MLNTTDTFAGKLTVSNTGSEYVAQFTGGNDTNVIIGHSSGAATGEQYISYTNGTTAASGNAWMVGMDDDENFKFAYGTQGEINGSTNVKVTITQAGNTTFGGDVSIDGELSVSGTIDLSNADLNIGAADIIFDMTSAQSNRGLVWDISGTGFISKFVGGGTNGGMVELYTNMDDAITTGDVFRLKEGSVASTLFSVTGNGSATFSSSVTANSFIKSGGTSSQFLKADGSVDSSSYSTTSHNHDSTYVNVTGDTMTGGLTSPYFRSTSGSTDFNLIARNNSSPALYVQNLGGADVFRVNYGSMTAGAGTTIFAANSSSSYFTSNLGIGTTSPSYKLDVNGVINGSSDIRSQRLTLRSDALERWEGAGDDKGIAINYFGYNTTFDYFRDLNIFNGKGQYIAKFDGSSRNVGIGTTSPSEKLEVGGNVKINSNTGVRINSYTSLGTTASGAMSILGHNVHVDSASNRVIASNTGYFAQWIKMYYNQGISFHTSNTTVTSGVTMLDGVGTNAYERMRIANNGNIGIGTDSPTEKLDVSGTAIVRSTFFTVGNVHGFNPSYGASYFINNNGGTTYFNANGGNVGIGTTSPSKALDVKGLVKIDADGTYGSSYGAIGFGGLSNGVPRVFGGITNKVLYLNFWNWW